MQEDITPLTEELGQVEPSIPTSEAAINVGQVTGKDVVVGTQITNITNNITQQVPPYNSSAKPPTDEVLAQGAGGGSLTLLGSIESQVRQTIAAYFSRQAQSLPLPPLEMSSEALIKKIEQILGAQIGALYEIERFILLVAACLPPLMREFGVDVEGLVSRQELKQVAQQLENRVFSQQFPKPS